MKMQPITPARRAAGAAAAGAKPAGKPRSNAQAAAAKAGQDALFFDGQITQQNIREYTGRLHSIGENVVQAFVKQRGGRERFTDFPASSVVAIISGGDDGDRFFVVEAAGPLFVGLTHEGYEGAYTKLADRKGRTVLLRTDSARVQSDKQAGGA